MKYTDMFGIGKAVQALVDLAGSIMGILFVIGCLLFLTPGGWIVLFILLLISSN